MEVKQFTPRKVTPQNKASLPPTHDETKRTSYMELTLNEDQMAQAVRNFIRGQFPISSEDELPVVFIAGRGDNGHSATVTVTPLKVTVVSPEQPTDAVPDYSTVSQAVIDHNAAQATNVANAAVQTKETEQPQATNEPEEIIQDKNLDDNSDAVETDEPVAEPQKASSLFGSKTVEEDEAVSEKEPEPVQEQEKPAEVKEEVKPKSTSIFANL